MEAKLRIEELTCECTICGRLTTMTSTKQCDGCWNLNMQLEMLIIRNKKKAIEFLLTALEGL